MVISRKTYLPPSQDDRESVVVAEFGSRFEAETAAAFVRTGGHVVQLRRIDPMSAEFAQNLERGRFELSVPADEAATVREAMLDAGVNPLALEPEPATLPWRSALVALAVLIGVALVTIVLYALQVRGGS